MITQEQYRAYASELSLFKSSECACKSCRSLCALVPCMGTPQDIKAIIDAGRGRILTRKWHLGSCCHGMPPLDIVMVRNVEIGSGCSQFDGEHCSLHHTGLKPSEGKFANHAEQHSLFWAIASMWFLEENAELVAWLRDQFPTPEPLDDAMQKACSEFAKLVNEEIAKLDDPNNLIEREEISTIANDQLQMFVQRYMAAQAVIEMLEGGAVRLEIVQIQASGEEKVCEVCQ